MAGLHHTMFPLSMYLHRIVLSLALKVMVILGAPWYHAYPLTHEKPKQIPSVTTHTQGTHNKNGRSLFGHDALVATPRVTRGLSRCLTAISNQQSPAHQLPRGEGPLIPQLAFEALPINNTRLDCYR